MPTRDNAIQRQRLAGIRSEINRIPVELQIKIIGKRGSGTGAKHHITRRTLRRRGEHNSARACRQVVVQRQRAGANSESPGKTIGRI